MTDDSLQMRDELLLAMLPHVPFDGWTDAALRHGLAEAGIDPAGTRDLFPRGAVDMVAHFSDWADRCMLESLDASDLPSMRVPERVRTAVQARLHALAPHREAVRRSLAVLAMPQNAWLGVKLLYRTVDAVWHAAGDTATDWNFYSKRGLLAGVVSATVLYWLNDGSDDSEDTWEFLDRRLRDVAAFGKTTGSLRERLSGFPRPYGASRR